ncbi:DUF3987 domain-containing protein [Streptomyces sp. PKU-EA00015]|uniref:YfjI family protein n=1 Tax=Streptomyces sp. PKU-EA00015 TaxID=2748326 RepID=UPI0015A2C933|nr:YfjI family protein [Streptomyces sp. PKU-EA00015]NWF27991.1 DUF3987 domain-containing protein [Streptomyces sp. PKU-EA00015]
MSTPQHAHGENVIPMTEAPNSIEAEQIVLGAVMADAAVLPEVEEELGQDTAVFYLPAHETIWRAILELVAASIPPTPIVLTDHLANSGDLQRVGGAPYLHTLYRAAPTASSGFWYARIVRRHAKRRQIAELGTRLMQAARDSGEDHDELLATARHALDLTEAEERWPAPTPLGQQGPLPTFPVDALPAWAAEQAYAVAEFTQTPTDMAATMALAVLSTAAGGRVHVQIRDGWVEQTNLYLVVAMPPASRKSDVFAAMTRPIYDIEAALQEGARASIIEAEVAKEAAEARAEAIMTKARKADDATASTSLVAEAAGLRMEAESIVVPPNPRLTASGDVTPETLTKLLSTHGRLGVLSPEGDLFDIIAGRYSSRPNLGVFLQGHKGERLQAERITRETDLGEKPALTIGITLQPPVLLDLAQTPGARGRGLLARFLFSLPASTLGYRQIVVPPVPEQVSRTYQSRLTTLVHTLTDLPEPVTIKCSGPADQAVIKLQEAIEPQLRPEGALAHIDDWAGKYVGAVARIAGLLHLAERATGRWGDPIEAATIERAVAIGEYYTAHALAAFDLMETDADSEKAQLVLDWIRRTKTTSFKAHELVTARRRAFPTVSSAAPALRLLEEHGYLRRLHEARAGGRGRQPAAVFRVHPSATGTDDASVR